MYAVLSRMRRGMEKSPVLQILLLILTVIGVMLLSEYLDLFPG